MKNNDQVAAGILWLVLIAMIAVIVLLSHLLYDYIVENEEMFLTILVGIIGATVAVTYSITRRKYEKIINEMRKK